MNDTTPPKLIPPFHSTAASGTLPIEQAKLTTATIGPTSGPHSPASTGWSVRKKTFQKSLGTHAASAPVISRPAVKLAPLRNNERARATAAYEHDDDAMPRPVAIARARGESSPSARITASRRTTARTIADSRNPRISAHRISHVIDPAIANACH